MIDDRLSFQKHIQSLSGRGRRLINIMRLLRNSATKDTLQLVYTSLCQSILSYCIRCWGGSHKTNMIALERAQRSILKVMLKKPFRYPTTALYKEINVLTIRKLFIFQVSLSQHQQIMNLPTYSQMTSQIVFRLVPITASTAFAQRFAPFLHPYIQQNI